MIRIKIESDLNAEGKSTVLAFIAHQMSQYPQKFTYSISTTAPTSRLGLWEEHMEDSIDQFQIHGCHEFPHIQIIEVEPPYRRAKTRLQKFRSDLFTIKGSILYFFVCYALVGIGFTLYHIFWSK